MEMIEDELAPKIKKAKRPVIKINFVSIKDELATTPARSVRAIVEFIRKYNSERILIVEEAVVGGSTFEGWERFGYSDLVRDHFGVELFDLKNDDRGSVEIYDREMKSFSVPFSKTMLDSDLLVSATRPKTHDTVVATLSGKNVAVGGIIDPDNKVRIHKGKAIHRSLVSILDNCPPHLCLLDGTVGMEGQGPGDGEPIYSGWTAAGVNWLAIDTLGACLMGFNIDDIGYLSLAEGVKYPSEVEVVGEDPKNLIKKFKPHSGFKKQIKWK